MRRSSYPPTGRPASARNRTGDSLRDLCTRSDLPTGSPSGSSRRDWAEYELWASPVIDCPYAPTTIGARTTLTQLLTIIAACLRMHLADGTLESTEERSIFQEGGPSLRSGPCSQHPERCSASRGTTAHLHRHPLYLHSLPPVTAPGSASAARRWSRRHIGHPEFGPHSAARQT